MTNNSSSNNDNHNDNEEWLYIMKAQSSILGYKYRGYCPGRKLMKHFQDRFKRKHLGCSSVQGSQKLHSMCWNILEKVAATQLENLSKNKVLIAFDGLNKDQPQKYRLRVYLLLAKVSNHIAHIGW